MQVNRLRMSHSTKCASSNAAVLRTAARIVAAVVIAIAIFPSTGEGQGRTRLNHLRFDGYVGPPPEGRNEVADLSLRVGKKDVRFQVTAATVLNGSISVGQVFNNVRPYRPNFILRGRQEVIARIEDAVPGTRLRIIGAWRRGSRDILVSTIEPQPVDEKQPPAEKQPSDNKPAVPE